MLVAFATYRVKRGLSLRSKQIFYPSGSATSSLFKAEAREEGTTIVDKSRSEDNSK